MLTIRQGRPITIKWYVMRPPNRQPILFSQREEGDIRITVTGPGRIPFGPLNYEGASEPRHRDMEYLNITISQHEVERQAWRVLYTVAMGQKGSGDTYVLP